MRTPDFFPNLNRKNLLKEQGDDTFKPVGSETLFFERLLLDFSLPCTTGATFSYPTP